ncbi:sensor histidine kinase [Streptomyces wuyuanensis]|uniref:sensor histidine kinase n=1 Tax=Streptomyces wuyuanensis TaxID=1196353 RepID=UPI003444663B
MTHIRGARRAHPWLSRLAVPIGAAALTVLVARAQQAGLHLYPQLSSGSYLTALLPGRLAVEGPRLLPVLACGLLLGRGRHPVAVACTFVALSAVAPVLAPLLVALFTVARTRPVRTTAGTAGAALLPVLAHPLLSPSAGPLAHFGPLGVATTVSALACVAGAVGWGLYIAGVQERARRAEADADLRAQQARQRSREEIAREMHDVLAHRLTLLSMHAGALEFHPTAPPDRLAEAAGVIRQSATRALEDLQDVLHVLRAPTVDGPAEPPQPTLEDLPRLVEESRAAGVRIDLEQRIDTADPLAPTTGRTAYRAVQEALTNHRKHAPTAPLSLAVTGDAEAGVTITAANPLAPPPAPAPGSRQGLIGMHERVTLAGGHMHHRLTPTGFRLEVWLPWTM